MITPTTLTVLVIGLSLALVFLLIARPSLTITWEGKILAFFALFLLPLLCTVVGFSDHMERSKQTTFCLSCHIMEPYGKSLSVDDPHYLRIIAFRPTKPATHATRTMPSTGAFVPNGAACITSGCNISVSCRLRKPSVFIPLITTVNASTAIWARVPSKGRRSTAPYATILCRIRRHVFPADATIRFTTSLILER
jgi:hypothetical protein